MGKINQKSLTVLLLVLLVLALAYIAFDKYVDYLDKKQFEVFQSGAQYGYEQAIVQIMQQLSTCQAVPLYAGNSTLRAVAVECLQQASAQQTLVSSKPV